MDEETYNRARDLFNLGVAALERGDLRQAEIMLLASHKIMPERESVRKNIAILYAQEAGLLCDRNDFVAAADRLELALRFDSTNKAIHLDRGLLLLDNLGDLDSAIENFRSALLIDSKCVAALRNIAVAFYKKGLYQDTVGYCDRTLLLDSSDSSAWCLRADSIRELQKPEEALLNYDRALKHEPDFLQALSNKATLLQEIGRIEEAILILERCVEITKHSDPVTFYNLGLSYYDLNRFSDAIEALTEASRLGFNGDYLFGRIVQAKLRICDWDGIEELKLKIETAILNRENVVTPLAALAMFDCPEIQRICAEVYVESQGKKGIDERAKNPSPSLVAKEGKSTSGRKIKIAYFSADFRDHPVSHLIVELIENHDRADFEVYGFSLGPDLDDEISRRLSRAFDHFVCCHGRSDLEAIEIARSRCIDIAVDLSGHTNGARLSIFKARVAPVQIAYLGFPGTFGHNCIDYLIADSNVVSTQNREFISENVIYLPDSFQVNPSSREATATISNRASHGIPDDAFVFCCFNNTWKLNRECLESWTRILHRASDSILWLYVENSQASENLRGFFRNSNIEPGRLFFSKRLSRADYLCNYKLADLFLDTYPYNAGTTASDALWMGVPVLTMRGSTFASRMASSLLDALELKELITEDWEGYEDLAVDLARNAGKLTELRTILKKRVITSRLFNPKLFAEHLESGYREILVRKAARMPLSDIYVNRIE